jgi:hypothetical protein
MTETGPGSTFPDPPPGGRWVLREKITPRQRMGYWFGGTIIASLIPFLPIIIHWIDGRPNTTGFYEALSRGELLAIGVVVALGGLADLAAVRGEVEDSAGWVITGALISLGGLAWYTDVAIGLMDNQPAPIVRLAWCSIAFFLLSAAVSLRSVYVAGGAR